MKVLVLGAGRVGAAIVRDLARDDELFSGLDYIPCALSQLRCTE
jgi:saccharopine dehydrogenase-like NADP-dependent oxidoreductase